MQTHSWYSFKEMFRGLLCGEGLISVAYYWKEFCVSKQAGFDNKTCFKELEILGYQPETLHRNSQQVYIQEVFLSETGPSFRQEQTLFSVLCDLSFEWRRKRAPFV